MLPHYCNPNLHFWFKLTPYVSFCNTILCWHSLSGVPLHAPRGRPGSQPRVHELGHAIVIKSTVPGWVLGSRVGTATNPPNLEYQPSPLAEPGSVYGPRPSGTGHPLKQKRRKHQWRAVHGSRAWKQRGKRWETRQKEQGGTENPQHAELMQEPKYRAGCNHDDGRRWLYNVSIQKSTKKRVRGEIRRRVQLGKVLHLHVPTGCLLWICRALSRKGTQQKRHSSDDRNRQCDICARKTNEMHIFPCRTQNPLQPENKHALHLFHCQTEGLLMEKFERTRTKMHLKSSVWVNKQSFSLNIQMW